LGDDPAPLPTCPRTAAPRKRIVFSFFLFFLFRWSAAGADLFLLNYFLQELLVRHGMWPGKKSAQVADSLPRPARTLHPIQNQLYRKASTANKKIVFSFVVGRILSMSTIKQQRQGGWNEWTS